MGAEDSVPVGIPIPAAAAVVFTLTCPGRVGFALGIGAEGGIDCPVELDAVVLAVPLVFDEWFDSADSGLELAPVLPLAAAAFWACSFALFCAAIVSLSVGREGVFFALAALFNLPPPAAGAAWSTLGFEGSFSNSF